MKHPVGLVAFALIAILANVSSQIAFAQDAWPSRPIKLIVASAPSGGTDVYARLIAQSLAGPLKQQLVVENRAGGNGTIGADAVAKSAPDGYTFLVSANPAIVIGPSLFKQPFNVERDFAPIARGVTSPLVICVHPAVSARSLAELIALGKRDPGKLAYGSAGIASTTSLGVRLLEEAASVKFLHVPYKGMGAAFQDFLGGQIAFVLTDLPSAITHIKAGKIIPLVANQRVPSMPSLPTFAEVGYPSVDVAATFSVLAPAGTPPSILERFSATLMEAMKTTMADKLDAQGLIPIFDSPTEATARLQRERDMWGTFIRRNKIAVE